MSKIAEAWKITHAKITTFTVAKFEVKVTVHYGLWGKMHPVVTP